MKTLRELVIRLMRVPPRPQPPPGSPDTLRVFRASPRFFEYSLIGWVAKQAGAFLGLLFSFVTLGFIDIGAMTEVEALSSVERFLLLAGGLFFLLQLPLSLIVLRFGYEMRWYMVSDRSLRIREGIFRVREQTMTVANIQNMAIRQGPLQKLFGISDLELQTAGGGGQRGREDGRGNNPLHQGLLRGLEDATEVRDLIREALGKRRDAGLGDPDEHPSETESAPLAQPQPDRPSPLLAAAEELLAEARALRLEVLGAEAPADR